ncbi:SA1362 family protein [Heyndrickxia sp. NPDC080065]|uniref:SA1362 family protein n=1 Tax=Heyndrickxia sp. NPDC080065 TaxID=3390568 RepID=UPI003D06CB10
MAFLLIRKWLFGLVFLLAIIGFGSLLFQQPGALFKQLIIGAFIICVVYMIYRIWLGKRSGAQDKRAFLKAARKSKKRIKNRQTSATTHTQALKKPIRKKSTANLTVIEGKKGKKKNRAIY